MKHATYNLFKQDKKIAGYTFYKTEEVLKALI